MKSIIRVTVAAAALAIALVPATGASAAPSAHSSRETVVQKSGSGGDRELHAFWTKYGVKASVQARLLKKLHSGRPWANVAGAPISSTRSTPSASIAQTVYTYRDGSIMVASDEVPAKASTSHFRTMASADLSKCTSSSGSGYRTFSGCSVSRNWGNVQGGFRASYTIVQGSEDYISSIWDNSTRCIAGDCTNYALTSKKKEDFYVAWAKFRWHYAAAKDAGSWDYWVQLTVGKDSASATSS